ncbi:hypothetical protein MG293_018114 [Ovis ammon polii]|uniref:Uncharacterized protein n=1 Tax=Ovis ammon polii TaxID=230172 RepID=A0AAD4TSJ7_OVIAM|nr:hypothetical protein MG293_018114 [Ovis ammon polii]KAI4551430.1 hypothetical protein MJT46_017682 [Ovis ammon polii x Ovis aries]
MLGSEPHRLSALYSAGERSCAHFTGLLPPDLGPVLLQTQLVPGKVGQRAKGGGGGGPHILRLLCRALHPTSSPPVAADSPKKYHCKISQGPPPLPFLLPELYPVLYKGGSRKLGSPSSGGFLKVAEPGDVSLISAWLRPPHTQPETESCGCSEL